MYHTSDAEPINKVVVDTVDTADDVACGIVEKIAICYSFFPQQYTIFSKKNGSGEMYYGNWVIVSLHKPYPCLELQKIQLGSVSFL